jgi:hypothetical protein
MVAETIRGYSVQDVIVKRADLLALRAAVDEALARAATADPRTAPPPAPAVVPARDRSTGGDRGVAEPDDGGGHTLLTRGLGISDPIG